MSGAHFPTAILATLAGDVPGLLFDATEDPVSAARSRG